MDKISDAQETGQRKEVALKEKEWRRVEDHLIRYCEKVCGFLLLHLTDIFFRCHLMEERYSFPRPPKDIGEQDSDLTSTTTSTLSRATPTHWMDLYSVHCKNQDFKC